MEIFDGIIIGTLYLKFFMKNILIFATIAAIGIVIAYYAVIEKELPVTVK